MIRRQRHDVGPRQLTRGSSHPPTRSTLSERPMRPTSRATSSRHGPSPTRMARASGSWSTTRRNTRRKRSCRFSARMRASITTVGDPVSGNGAGVNRSKSTPLGITLDGGVQRSVAARRARSCELVNKRRVRRLATPTSIRPNPEDSRYGVRPLREAMMGTPRGTAMEASTCGYPRWVCTMSGSIRKINRCNSATVLMPESTPRNHLRRPDAGPGTEGAPSPAPLPGYKRPRDAGPARRFAG